MADKTPIAFVLRHGDTVLNDDNCFRGMLDPEINDEGILDAHAAAKFLKDKGIERIITSPLLRAVMTAEIVSGLLGGIHITQDRGLFPWQMGTDFYGQDREELSDRLEHYVKNPDKTPENGQSLSEFVKGIGDFFEERLKCPIITLYITHTSDIISISDLIHGEPPTHPEKAEVVKPGGICAIYSEGDDYEIEPIFKSEQRPAEFGS